MLRELWIVFVISIICKSTLAGGAHGVDGPFTSLSIVSSVLPTIPLEEIPRAPTPYVHNVHKLLEVIVEIDKEDDMEEITPPLGAAGRIKDGTCNVVSEDERLEIARLDTLLESKTMHTLFTYTTQQQCEFFFSLALKDHHYYTPLFYEHSRFQELLAEVDEHTKDREKLDYALWDICRNLHSFFIALARYDAHRRVLYLQKALYYLVQTSKYDAEEGPVPPPCTSEIV